MWPTPEDCATAAWERYYQDQIETPPEEPPMTRELSRRDVAQWSIRNGLSLTPEEIDYVVESANHDGDKGGEWLPYYKAALGVLAELTGCLAKYVESGAKPDAVVVAAMKRAWLLHLYLGGIGPEQDAATAAGRKAFAEGEANAAFYALEEKAMRGPCEAQRQADAPPKQPRRDVT